MNNDLLKFLITGTYDLDDSKITDFKIDNGIIKFSYGKGFSYHINEGQITKLLHNFKLAIGSKEDRVAVVIMEDVLKYNLGKYRRKNELMMNFVRLCSMAGVGVDIISNTNVSNYLQSYNKYDINVFFPYKKKTSNSIITVERIGLCRKYNIDERVISDLNESITQYLSSNKPSIIVSNDVVSLMALSGNTALTQNKKYHIFHSQETIDYPNVSRLNDSNIELLDEISMAKKYLINAITTSDECESVVKKVVRNINTIQIDELGLNNIVAPELVSFGHSNRDILHRFTNTDCLNTVVESIIPLGLDLTILCNEDEIETINNMLNGDNLDFIQYRLIDNKYFDIINKNYDVYIDFREDIEPKSLFGIKSILNSTIEEKTRSNVADVFIKNVFEFADSDDIISVIKSIVTLKPEIFESEEEIKPKYYKYNQYPTSAQKDFLKRLVK